MLVKLVYFNPGSIATVIQNLAVYEVPQPLGGYHADLLSPESVELRRPDGGLLEMGTKKTTKLSADNFQYLIVSDSRVIFVKLPGMSNRLDNALELKTNHGFLVISIRWTS